MTFKIHARGRLQEWVADAKGYFVWEGLTDYVLVQPAQFGGARCAPADPNRRHGRTQEVRIGPACRWTVGIATSNARGEFWRDAYSISPSGIFVAADSKVRSLADLAEVEVDVGYQSGSHYTTIQTLEATLDRSVIRLNFGGSPDQRLARLVAGQSEAATLFGIQLYIAEQLGFRKIADTTFSIIGRMPDDVDSVCVAQYYAALRLAQQDIDLRHQDYAHFYLREIPREYHDRIDVTAFGPGERIVFEPYSPAMYEKTHQWVQERTILAPEKVGRVSCAERH